MAKLLRYPSEYEVIVKPLGNELYDVIITYDKYNPCKATFTIDNDPCRTLIDIIASYPFTDYTCDFGFMALHNVKLQFYIIRPEVVDPDDFFCAKRASQNAVAVHNYFANVVYVFVHSDDIRLYDDEINKIQLEYLQNHVAETFKIEGEFKPMNKKHTPYPSKIIINYPMTICIWPDGTKTYSKHCAGDDYDPRLAVLNCMVKKYIGLGATARLHDIFEILDRYGQSNGSISLHCDGHIKEEKHEDR